MKILYILLSTVFLNLFASANPVYYQTGQWGMLYPLSGSGLEIIDEKIEIDVYRCSEFVSGTAFFYSEYECEYTLRNNNQSQSLTIGFPVDYPYAHQDNYRSFYNFIDDLQIKCHGQELNFNKYIHGINPDYKDINYDFVYGFDLYMQHDKEVKLIIKYTKIDYMLSWEAADKEVGAFYILKTGKTLSKPISNAEITVRFHFPTDKTKTKSLLNLKVNYSEHDPYCIVKYMNKNFIPDYDFFVPYNEDYLYFYKYNGQTKQKEDSEYKELEKNIQTMIKNLDRENTLQSYFDLIRVDVKYRSLLSNSQNKQMIDSLNNFYRKAFNNKIIPPQLLGFLLYNYKNDNKQKKDTNLVLKVKKYIDTFARKTKERELRLLKKISSIDRNTLRNTEVFKSFLSYLFQVDMAVKDIYAFNAKTPDKYNNDYLKSIQEYLSQDDFVSEEKKVISLFKRLIPEAVNNLIRQEQNNLNEILNVLNLSSQNGFNFKEYFKKSINSQIHILLDKNANSKINDKKRAAYVLEKLVKVIKHASFFYYGPDNTEIKDEQPASVKYGTGYWLDSASVDFQCNERKPLRKAYEALGDFNINSNTEAAIRFYILGLSYGNTSPIWDYLTGTMLTFYFEDTYPQLYFGKNTSETKGMTDEKYKQIAPPWGKELNAYQNGITDDAIIRLFTPERLLSLRLDCWVDEGEENSPSSILAYKTALAYLHMEDQYNALKWLKVAFKANKKFIRIFINGLGIDIIYKKYENPD
ncbi:MAG: hypothetical protein JW969_01225 [Spirochaetales bacterium]|nr:hypothetical protein [Spirochaetales bacterium]